RGIQIPAGHALGLLRAGQLESERPPNAEPRSAVGSLSALLRPRRAGVVLPAGNHPALEAVSERAARIPLWWRAQRSRLSGGRVRPELVEHRSASRARLPADSGREDQPAHGLGLLLHTDPGE